MERTPPLLAARGLTDEHDRLLSADEPLAELHARCGGAMPGALAVPELLDLVQQSRQMDLRLAREFSAFDGEDVINGFARVQPLDGKQGGGCEVLIENWRRTPLQAEDEQEVAGRQDAIDRSAAEIVLRLDAQQRVQLVSKLAEDAEDLSAKIASQPMQVWTEYVQVKDISHQQPLHWRLLDGARCVVPGSQRSWRARVIPNDLTAAAVRFFELLLIADTPLVRKPSNPQPNQPTENSHTRLVGSALTPALRQPIARIIANAETIKTRLAGPLRAEYSEYAGNIAAAGQHLTSMLEDLADLEVVEAPGFSTIREKVELGDAARRAGGILGVRAQENGITLDLPDEEDKLVATAEFRRVIQILINLIGNAIAYSPTGSTVSISIKKAKPHKVTVTVADEGPGVTEAQAQRIFEKFERLGRDDESGSGLGLYISKRLALAMDGDLVLDSAEGQGARFTLILPSAKTKKKKK